MPFIKAHSELVTSSIWEGPYHLRIAWTALMVTCGTNGVSPITEASLYRVANITKDEAEEAIRAFTSPDPKSRTPDYDGRRIERVSGGFKLLNYFKYRDIRTPEQKNAYMRDYMKKYRKQKKEGLTWQEVYKAEADDALALPIPAQFGAEVEEATINFLSMRHNLATEPQRKQDRVRLSSAMAKALFEEIEVALITRTKEEVAAKLRSAAISGYRSPRFNSLFK